MKKLYLVILLAMFSIIKSQIINIPDAYLKTKLFTYGTAIDGSGNYITLDANGDGEVQIIEAQAVKKLTIYHLTDMVTSLSGLNEFPNLLELELNSPDISTFDLIFSNYPTLQKIKINGGVVGNMSVQNCNSLFSIDFEAHGNIITIQNTSAQEVKIQYVNAINISSSPNIKKFSLFKFSASSLDLNDLPQLQDVSITESHSLSNINFAGSTGLKKIIADYNHLSTLSIPNPSIVEYISIIGNLFQTFNATPYTSLITFIGANNQITSLNFTSPFLYSINAINNSLSSIVFNNNTNLQYLELSNNLLEQISLQQLSFLKTLSANNNLLKSVDLTKNTKIESFNLSDNPNLETLFMKHGKTNFSSGPGYSFAFPNTPQLKYVCTDPITTSWVNSLMIQYNQPNVVVNSYCSFTPGGTYYTVQGNTKYDMNGNGCDSTDIPKAYQKFNVFSYTSGQGQVTLTSSSNGSHFFPLPIGYTSITPILENPSYFTVTPPSTNVTFPNQISPISTQNFCLTANGTHNDLEVLIIPTTAAVPGFDTKYKIVYKNKGTTPQSGNIVFNFTNNLMVYQSATIIPNSQSTGSLNWNFTNLLPFETKEITVVFKLNTPTQTPPVNGGDILHYTAQISGATDETPADNHFTLNQTVVNSFDPNDKTCLEGTSIAQTQVGDYVHYLIRFENTGTANAKNIVVKDEIDTTKFDISSLVALSGSHDFVTNVSNPNVVEFIFENIQLPFDDANNDGYVSFKIKTKSTLTIGNSFSNTAHIYFDYNHPIVTNTYTTNVQNVLATTETGKQNAVISIYPNPVKDVLNIQSKNEIVKAEIYDAAGRIISSINVKGNSVPVSELSKGSYILKAFTKDKVIVQKFIKD